MINDLSPQQAYPLPHSENLLQQDVTRIRDALVAIDADVWQQQQSEQAQQQVVTEHFRRIKLNNLLGESLLMI